MKKVFLTLSAVTLGSGAALAGGIERAPQSLAPLFEAGNYAELSFGGVNPTVRGRDVAGVATGDVAQGYGFAGLAYKHQFTDAVSGAFIIEQPFGADILYPTANSPVLGGTLVSIDSVSYTAVLRYKFDNNVSVHGGLRGSHASGNVSLRGAGYSASSGYDLDIEGTWGLGWVAGLAYEIPDIAARVSLTYNSPIDHDFGMTESGGLLAATGQGVVHGKHEVRTPRSWTLEGQTGVAEDTLVFGSIRWVKWSEFVVENAHFPITPDKFPVPDGTDAPLVELKDTTTYTIGVGRKFTENWAGSASLVYEPSRGSYASPLAPTNGRKGITLAAIYTQDNLKISTGINYSKLGKTALGVGQRGDSNKTHVGNMDKGDVWGIGVRIGYSF